jgi:type I restriction enzyme, R subunit
MHLTADEIEKKAQEKLASNTSCYRMRHARTIRRSEKGSPTRIDPQAASTFNGQLNEYIENVRKEHEQIIDHVNIDTVTKSEWDSFTSEKANETIERFYRISRIAQRRNKSPEHFLQSAIQPPGHYF